MSLENRRGLALDALRTLGRSALFTARGIAFTGEHVVIPALRWGHQELSRPAPRMSRRNLLVLLASSAVIGGHIATEESKRVEKEQVEKAAKLAVKLLPVIPFRDAEVVQNDIPEIIKALAKEGIDQTNVIAYAMATVEHETAGYFKPIPEIDGPAQALRNGYSGGVKYYGRGYIQITHDFNYLKYGKRIGLGDQLLKDPELALNKEISAKILAAYFKDEGVAKLASEGRFIEARRPINPDHMGPKLAVLADKYKRALLS